MSKTVGYVLTAALVVFAIAVPIIGPTALAAWGFSAGTVAAIGAALSAAVIVNSLLMPKPKSSNNAQETTLQLGEVARRALFGKSATAGSLVDVFNYDERAGMDWRRYWRRDLLRGRRLSRGLSHGQASGVAWWAPYLPVGRQG
jgi:hypothetical protein